VMNMIGILVVACIVQIVIDDSVQLWKDGDK
jgi:hypothetical protein